jgi:hypothetical protein
MVIGSSVGSWRRLPFTRDSTIRLELMIAADRYEVLHPDRASFPHLRYPPFFTDLVVDSAKKPELRIDGYVGAALVLSRSFSADTTKDRLLLHADDYGETVPTPRDSCSGSLTSSARRVGLREEKSSFLSTAQASLWVIILFNWQTAAA